MSLRVPSGVVRTYFVPFLVATIKGATPDAVLVEKAFGSHLDHADSVGDRDLAERATDVSDVVQFRSARHRSTRNCSPMSPSDVGLGCDDQDGTSLCQDPHRSDSAIRPHHGPPRGHCLPGPLFVIVEPCFAQKQWRHYFVSCSTASMMPAPRDADRPTSAKFATGVTRPRNPAFPGTCHVGRGCACNADEVCSE